MQMVWWLLVVAVAIAGVFYFTSLGRYAKTLWLILEVKPYEQAGTGAGNILVIGDSTGYGTGAGKSNLSVAGRLGAEFPGYKISNNSKNGRQISGALEVAKSVTSDYDLVLLQIGANDLLAKRPIDAIVADMQALVATLKPHTRHIVIISSGNIGAAPAFSGEEAKEYQQLALAYSNKMQEWTEGVEAVDYVYLYDEPKDDPFVKEPKRYMASDGLHPSSEGYLVWYEKARPYFMDLLQE